MSSKSLIDIKIDELANSILRSKVFTEKNNIDHKVSQDVVLMNMINAYNEIEERIEIESKSEEIDKKYFDSLIEERNKLLSELEKNPLIIDLTKSKDDFAKMIYQINEMLNYMVTGNKPRETCNGCENCEKCTLGEL